MDSTKACSFPSCDKPHHCGGFCSKHYSRLQRHGDPARGDRRSRPRCSVEDCEKPHYGKGYCVAHYTRLRNHGDITVNLSRRNQVEFIESLASSSTEDCIFWPFTRNEKGYGVCQIRINGIVYLSSHRAALASRVPPVSDKPFALHACHNGHLGCVNPNHLYWGTAKNNRADLRNSGRKMVKLNKMQIEDIRSLLAKGGMTHRQIGMQFGVSKHMIQQISSGRCWAGVELQPKSVA